MRNEKRKIQSALRIVLHAVCCVMVWISISPAQQAETEKASKDEPGYRIDKPGTITFTVGVKIKGKVQKPQVMIFLPKEKPAYNEVTITHSFLDAIMEPLPLNPEEK